MYRNTSIETMNNAIIALNCFEVINGFEKESEAQ